MPMYFSAYFDFLVNGQTVLLTMGHLYGGLIFIDLYSILNGLALCSGDTIVAVRSLRDSEARTELNSELRNIAAAIFHRRRPQNMIIIPLTLMFISIEK